MFKEIIADFKEYRIWLQNWLFYRRHAIKMSLAIRLADMKQRAFNRQYHVMLLESPAGDKLTSINRDDFFRLKRKKWLPKESRWDELKRTSVFYSTPLSRNNKTNSAERKAAKEKYLKYAKKYMR